MKTLLKMLIAFTLVTSAFARGGDGTLPLLRNISVDFQNAADLSNIRLPRSLNLNISRDDLQGNKIVKKIRLNNKQLEQEFHISERNGNLDLDLNTSFQGRKLGHKTSIKPLNGNLFMTSTEINGTELVQMIELR